MTAIIIRVVGQSGFFELDPATCMTRLVGIMPQISFSNSLHYAQFYSFYAVQFYDLESN